MIGISTYCLIEEPLPVALDRLSGLTGLIEVMDEGPHFVDSPELFESYSADFILHAPYHGMNIACLFEAVRKASVEVMTDCFARAAEIGAAVVLHRAILHGNRSASRPQDNLQNPSTSFPAPHVICRSRSRSRTWGT